MIWEKRKNKEHFQDIRLELNQYIQKHFMGDEAFENCSEKQKYRLPGASFMGSAQRLSMPAPPPCVLPVEERGPVEEYHADEEDEEECIVGFPNFNLDDRLSAMEETFAQTLFRMIDERNLKDSAVYKDANIDRRLFSKIRGDMSYIPAKKTVLSFAFALKLSLSETKELLEKAGYALSPASKFDVIISFLIEKKEYNINFVNIVLDEYGEGSLSR